MTALACFWCLLQANQIGHIVCGCCSITLMYAHGAQCVKCAVCNNVTPVNASTVTLAPSADGAGGSGQPAKTVSVVVHNPPTLDDQGNEVCHAAICPHRALFWFDAGVSLVC